MYSSLYGLVETFCKLAGGLSSDIQDAIEHLRVSVDIPNNFLISTEMFDISYHPSFDYTTTGDDLSSWPEWADGELLGFSEEEAASEVVGFRGRNWAKMAERWLQGKFPHIVIIDAGNFHEISDGRGRVSLAIGLSLKSLPAITMTLKDPNNVADEGLKLRIEELIQMINSVYT